MKVVDVETLMLTYQMEKPLLGGRGRFDRKEGLLVRIRTDEGLIGIGEANTWGNMTAVATIIESNLKPLLVGENPTDIERLWEKMYRATSTFGRRGIAVVAISGVDIALWDLLGKTKDIPIYVLLGGRFHTEIKAYASGLYPQDPKDLAREARGYIDQGFTAMKQRLGVNPSTDVELVRTVREAIGQNAELMVDACASWNPIAVEDWRIREKMMRSRPSSVYALKIARQLEQYDLAWIEEPLPPDDLDGMAQLAASLDTPIAIGENVFTKYEFRDVLVKRAADIVQPDATRAGGLTEVKKICAMAAAWHLPCVPHIWSTGVGLAANLHLITSTPNALYAEYDTLTNPLRHELIRGALKPIKGFMKCPDGPGLGVELDQEVLNRYLIRRSS